MDTRNQRTTDYQYNEERQPVRSAAQTGATTGARYANTANPAAARRGTQTSGAMQMSSSGMGTRTASAGTRAASMGMKTNSVAGTGGASSARNASASSSIDTKPRTAAQVRRDREARERAARMADAKSAKAASKLDVRLLVLSVMGLFVLGAMGWGICQHIKGINMRGELTTYEAVQSIKKIEDNSKNAGKSIDVEKLIQKVLDNVVFEAELNKLDDSVAEGMITIAEGTKLQFYAGNGIYADELIVMTARNEEDAKQNQENVKTHLAETKKAFQDYIPEEASKIDNAVSIRCGCYVIVCITSDYEKAEKTINAIIQE